MLAAYRRTGADPPFGDPRGWHGVGLEGYYWRFAHAPPGRAVAVILAISRDADGAPWGLVALAGHPGGFVRSGVAPTARAAPHGLDVRLGDGEHTVLAASEDRLLVDLGADARLDVRLDRLRPWPRRVFGALGPAQVVPRLSQYWHAHLLGGRARGSVTLGGSGFELDGFSAYAEKNWGEGGMPPAWWWGQAGAFEREDAAVAFAGGRAGVGRLRVGAGALVVALGGDVLRIVRPLQPLRVDLGDGTWRLGGHTGVHRIEVEGVADGPPHMLPVPVPSARRVLEARSPQHMAGTLRVRVSRRGRTVYEGESPLAAFEQGRGAGQA
jgi:hypothetical protein